MDDLRFTPAVLVTGQDDRGNEFCWWYSNEKYFDGYNECEIAEKLFVDTFPLVQKVYFSDVVMTGDQWREIQCPLSMSTEQLDQWSENIQYVDAWAYPSVTEQERIDDMLSGDPERMKKYIPPKIVLQPYKSQGFRSQPLSAEEVDGELILGE